MQRFFGRNVNIYFKGDDTIVGGILLDCDEENIYIQSDQEVAIVPRQNIKFYTTPKFVSSQTNTAIQPTPAPVHNTKPPEQVHPEAVKVIIDGILITTIPVPPTFNLAVCSEDLLKVIWGNPDVQSALRGRVQKQIEYSIGEAKIITAASEQVPESGDGSFSMSPTGGAITNQFVNPSEMVQRLNNIVRGRKDE